MATGQTRRKTWKKWMRIFNSSLPCYRFPCTYEESNTNVGGTGVRGHAPPKNVWNLKDAPSSGFSVWAQSKRKPEKKRVVLMYIFQILQLDEYHLARVSSGKILNVVSSDVMRFDQVGVVCAFWPRMPLIGHTIWAYINRTSKKRLHFIIGLGILIWILDFLMAR